MPYYPTITPYSILFSYITNNTKYIYTIKISAHLQINLESKWEQPKV
jgi:hypothetical protein